MEVLQIQPQPDIQFSKEKPASTHLVTLPILGGCNEFTIGSDNLSEDQLEQIGSSICSYIANQQYISKRVPLRFLAQLSYIVSLRDLQPISTIPPRTNDFLEEARKLDAVFSVPGSEL